MGDLIEFKTWPKHQRLFYEAANGGITFWVKSCTSVIVGLATRPNKECSYEVTIEPDKCLLKTKSEVCSINEVDDILFGNEFRKCWISWKHNAIVFGSGRTVVLRWKCEVKNHIKYVTFYSDKDSGMAEWKCYLPQVVSIQNLPLKRLHGGEPYWVQLENNSKLPDGALIGGYENEFLYIMRAPFRGSLTPGKFVPSVGLGFIAWGYVSNDCETVEILCGYNCVWFPSKDDEVPAGAVEGGYSEVNHEILYVGRVHHNGHLIVGKVQPSHRCCYFAYEDKTRSDRIFEVLVVPNSKMTVPIFTNYSDESDEISEDNIRAWYGDHEI